MPNWCQNKLVIESKTFENYKLLEFQRKYLVEDEDGELGIKLDKIVPMPKTKYDNDREWYNWYEWQVRYWGTKWEVYDSKVDVIKEKIGGEEYVGLEITFDTAWSPVIPVVAKLISECSHDDINIKYSYYEAGEFFAGRIKWNQTKKEYEYKELKTKKAIENLAETEGFNSYWF